MLVVTRLNAAISKCACIRATKTNQPDKAIIFNIFINLLSALNYSISAKRLTLLILQAYTPIKTIIAILLVIALNGCSQKLIL